MAGRTCPYCRFALEQGDEVVACHVCEAVHHGDCWEENGGCAVALCAGGPSRGDAQEQGPEQVPVAPAPALPRREPLPVVVTPDPSEAPTRKRERSMPPSQPPGAPPPVRPGGGAWIPLIAVVIVLLGGAGAAAVVIGTHGESSTVVTAEQAAEASQLEAAEYEEGLGEEEFGEDGYEEESGYEEGGYEEEEEFEPVEPSPSPSKLAQVQVQQALRAHFHRIAAGNYETAFYDLTSSEGESAGGEAAWVEGQEEDQLQSFGLSVETSLSDPHTAQATIVNFETHSLATGCNTWSGYWEMRKIYGEWLIDAAKLEREPC
jgi:hypothetical protein